MNAIKRRVIKATKKEIQNVKEYREQRKAHELAYDIHHDQDPALNEDLKEMGVDQAELIPEGIDEGGYDEYGNPVLTHRNLEAQRAKQFWEETKEKAFRLPLGYGKGFRALADAGRDLKSLHEAGCLSELKEGVKQELKRAREETKMSDHQLSKLLFEMNSPRSKIEKLTVENLKWLERYLEVYALDHPRYSEVLREVRARVNRITSERKSAQQSKVADSTEPGIPKKIKQLKDMLENGLITEEEFNTKKSELLARM
jgi:hypothetical protein